MTSGVGANIINNILTQNFSSIVPFASMLRRKMLQQIGEVTNADDTTTEQSAQITQLQADLSTLQASVSTLQSATADAVTVANAATQLETLLSTYALKTDLSSEQDLTGYIKLADLGKSNEEPVTSAESIVTDERFEQAMTQPLIGYVDQILEQAEDAADGKYLQISANNDDYVNMTDLNGLTVKQIGQLLWDLKWMTSPVHPMMVGVRELRGFYDKFEIDQKFSQDPAYGMLREYLKFSGDDNNLQADRGLTYNQLGYLLQNLRTLATPESPWMVGQYPIKGFYDKKQIDDMFDSSDPLVGKLTKFVTSTTDNTNAEDFVKLGDIHKDNETPLVSAQEIVTDQRFFEAMTNEVSGYTVQITNVAVDAAEQKVDNYLLSGEIPRAEALQPGPGYVPLSSYARKNEVPALADVYTKAEVDAAITASNPDLAGYVQADDLVAYVQTTELAPYTKTQDIFDAMDIDSLTLIPNRTYVDNKYNIFDTNLTNYIRDKTQDAVDGLYMEGALLQPEAKNPGPGYYTIADYVKAANVYTKAEVNTKTEVDAKIQAAVDAIPELPTGLVTYAQLGTAKGKTPFLAEDFATLPDIAAAIAAIDTSNVYGDADVRNYLQFKGVLNGSAQYVVPTVDGGTYDFSAYLTNALATATYATKQELQDAIYNADFGEDDAILLLKTKGLLNNDGLLALPTAAENDVKYINLAHVEDFLKEKGVLTGAGTLHEVNLTNYYTQSQVYNKGEVDTMMADAVAQIPADVNLTSLNNSMAALTTLVNNLDFTVSQMVTNVLDYRSEQVAHVATVQNQIDTFQTTVNTTLAGYAADPTRPIVMADIYQTRNLLHHVMVLCQDPIIQFNYRLTGIGDPFAGDFTNSQVRIVPPGPSCLQWAQVEGVQYNTQQFGLQNVYTLSQSDFVTTLQKAYQVAGQPSQCQINLTAVRTAINQAGGIMDQFFSKVDYDPNNPLPNSDYFTWSVEVMVSPTFLNSTTNQCEVSAFVRDQAFAADIRDQGKISQPNVGTTLKTYTTELDTPVYYQSLGVNMIDGLTCTISSRRFPLTTVPIVYVALPVWVASQVHANDIGIPASVRVRIHPSGTLTSGDIPFQ